MNSRTKKNRKRLELAFAPTLLRVLGAAAASAAIALGAYGLSEWAHQSPVFEIRTITFNGNVHATDAELARFGGLQLGQNLIALDAIALERLIAAHPWVKDARVNRHFPNGLYVQITEHRPAAMVSLGDLYLLDEDGEPFKRVQPSDALDLPIVTGIEREDYVARHDETVARLTEALQLASTYAASPAGKAAPLSEVHLALAGVTLVTADGLQVQLGEGSWPEKLKRLARVRQELKGRSLKPAVIRLDNRARPSSVTVSLQTIDSPTSPERGGRTGK